MKQVLIICLFCSMFFACKEKHQDMAIVFTISEEPLTFAFEGGTIAIPIKESNTTWKARTDADWYTVEPESGNIEDRQIKITVTPNDGIQRSSLLIIDVPGIRDPRIQITQSSFTP